MGYDMYEEMGLVTIQVGPKIPAEAETCSGLGCRSATSTYPARNANPSSTKNRSHNLWGPLSEGEMMMKRNQHKSFVTEQDIEAALQLIHLKNHLQNFVTTNSDKHLRSEIHEPFMKIVQKSKEFLEAQDIKHNKKDVCSAGDDENTRKRKNDHGIASCSSSLTFDLDDSSDEDGNEVVGSVKKMKKFRSIVDIYNVTKPL